MRYWFFRLVREFYGRVWYPLGKKIGYWCELEGCQEAASRAVETSTGPKQFCETHASQMESYKSLFAEGSLSEP